MTTMANVLASTPVVQLENISRSFAGQTVVRDLSLELRRGEFFSLLGPSGCGKTTTLRMIAGFERPDTGRILIKGQDVGPKPPNLRPVNTVFQSYALFSHLSVGENVAFGLREKCVPRAERNDAVSSALALVRLSGYESRRPTSLSGGEQQRVALARAIVNQPSVLLLDEPLGALDLKLRRAMQEELKALQRRLEMTFLYVTHDQEEALLMSDRIGVMSKGKLEQVGTPEELYRRPDTSFVADFVGEANIIPARLVSARGDARAQVRLPGGQIINTACKNVAAPDSAGVLIIRPEKLRIDRTGSSENSLVARVADAFFVGAFQRLVVDLGENTPRLVLISMDASPRPGEQITLSFDPDDAWFLLDDSFNGAPRTASRPLS